MSNLTLLRNDEQLIIVKPTDKLLDGSTTDEIVSGIQFLLKAQCRNQVTVWMITDGTIRIQHNREQEIITEVLGLCDRV